MVQFKRFFKKTLKKYYILLLLYTTFFGKRKYKLKIVIHTQKYIIYTYIIFNNNELFFR